MQHTHLESNQEPVCFSSPPACTAFSGWSKPPQYARTPNGYLFADALTDPVSKQLSPKESASSVVTPPVASAQPQHHPTVPGSDSKSGTAVLSAATADTGPSSSLEVLELVDAVILAVPSPPPLPLDELLSDFAQTVLSGRQLEAENSEFDYDEDSAIFDFVTAQGQELLLQSESTEERESIEKQLTFLGLSASHAQKCAHEFAELLNLAPLPDLVLHYLRCARHVPQSEFPTQFASVAVGRSFQYCTDTSNTPFAVHFVRQPMQLLAGSELKQLCAASPVLDPPADQEAFYYHGTNHAAATSILKGINPPRDPAATDFTAGTALYLSPSYAAAEYWAKYKFNKQGAAVVVFRFSRSALYSEAKVTDPAQCELGSVGDAQTLSRWKQLVKESRSGRGYGPKAGFAYGPMSKAPHPTLLESKSSEYQMQFAVTKPKRFELLERKLCGVIFFPGNLVLCALFIVPFRW
jgi:hypothetical protein